MSNLMSARIRYVVGALLLAALVVAACGSGPELTSTPAATPLPAPSAAVTATPVPAPTAERSAAEVLKLAIDAFMSGLPNDYMAMGRMEDVRAAIDAGIFLIDVREPGEYAAGHINGAVNIPLRSLAQNLDKVPSDQPVLIYCASSLRTSTATSVLRLLGYNNVQSFPGGCTALVDAGEATSTELIAAQSFAPKEVDAATLAAVDAFLAKIPAGYYALGTVDEFRGEVAKGAMIVDVREEWEYADGAIPGAVNIPIRTLAKSLAQIPQDKPAIIYCASGHRAAVATAMLHMLGYDRVRAFPGGYGAWEAAQGEAGDVPAEVTTPVVSASSDVVTTVSAFLSGIPDNFHSVGNLEVFKEALESAGPLLIDVREPAEYAAGHIEGAVNLPLRTLTDNRDKIPADKPLIVYCASGHRSGMAAAALTMLGYSNVRAFPGGWHVWNEAGEPSSTKVYEAVPVTPKEVDPEMLAVVAGFLHTIPDGFLAVGDVAALKTAIDNGAALIDVREEAELAEGQIAGAVSIPLRTLGENLNQVPTGTPVIVYCASGHRAAMAAAALRVMGYDNAYSFPAGYGVWQAAGEATE